MLVKWKYRDSERPNAGCYDCGLEYGGDSWIETSLAPEHWEEINPTYHKGAGLLCISCIARRFKSLGYGPAEIPIRLCGMEPIKVADDEN